MSKASPDPLVDMSPEEVRDTLVERFGTHAIPEKDGKPTPPITLASRFLAQLSTLADVPRPFTLKEQQAYNEIEAKHGYDDLQNNLAVAESRATLESRNARLDAVRANIKAFEKRRDAEFERDELRPDVIASITDQIVTACDEEARLALESVEDTVRSYREQTARSTELIEAQERVYIETVHALAELHKVKVPNLDAFIEAATPEDYDAAAVIVEEGLTATPLNRASRRAAARRERQRVSRSRPSQAD